MEKYDVPNRTALTRAIAISSYPDLVERYREVPSQFRALALEAQERRQTEKRGDWVFPSDLRDGRFQDVLGDIADDSVGAIFSDLPWNERHYEMTGLYEDVAKFCARVLMPGRLAALLVSPGEVRNLILAADPHLSFEWAMPYHVQVGRNERVQIHSWHYQVLIFKKGQGQTNLRWQSDSVVGAIDPDRVHQFGKSPDSVFDIIEKLADPPELIVDPCAGSGTTGIAAERNGYRFIGATLDRFR